MKTFKKTEDHYTVLLEAANTKGLLSTKEATELLQVSESTVRRLFNSLEKSGKVIRTFGGIACAKTLETTDDYIFALEAPQYTQMKHAIGIAAAESIVNEDIIYIDAGSTTLQLAFALSERLARQELSNLIVVTNSIAHVHALGDYCKVLSTGGEYQKNSNSFVGPLAEDFVARFNYTKCFLGCDGFSATQGASSKNLDSARINQHVLRRSNRSYLLTTSNKMEALSFYPFAPLDTIDCIISDDGTPAIIRNITMQLNKELIIR